MKIEIQWEAKDVRAGMKVRRAKTSEVWMIGVDPSCDDSTFHYAFISACDGMIASKGLDRSAIAVVLNNGYLPEEVWALADALTD